MQRSKADCFFEMCKAVERGRIGIPQSIISLLLDTQDKLDQKGLDHRQVSLFCPGKNIFRIPCISD